MVALDPRIHPFRPNIAASYLKGQVESKRFVDLVSQTIRRRVAAFLVVPGPPRHASGIAFLNRVLEYVFARVTVDPQRVVLGGFSDGATYALSLGLANGDLFPRVAAFSPGFVIPAAVRGHARFFISHGRSDQILPIDQCSRVIVPQLRAKGYDVTFKEFDGRHEVPPEIAADAMRWMTS